MSFPFLQMGKGPETFGWASVSLDVSPHREEPLPSSPESPEIQVQEAPLMGSPGTAQQSGVGPALAQS